MGLIFNAIEERDVSRTGSRERHARARVCRGGASVDGTGASGRIRIGVFERDGSRYWSTVGFYAQHAALGRVAEIRNRHVTTVTVTHKRRAVLPRSETSAPVRSCRVPIPSTNEFSTQIRSGSAPVRLRPAGWADGEIESHYRSGRHRPEIQVVEIRGHLVPERPSQLLSCRNSSE